MELVYIGGKALLVLGSIGAGLWVIQSNRRAIKRLKERATDDQ